MWLEFHRLLEARAAAASLKAMRWRGHVDVDVTLVEKAAHRAEPDTDQPDLRSATPDGCEWPGGVVEYPVQRLSASVATA